MSLKTESAQLKQTDLNSPLSSGELLQHFRFAVRFFVALSSTFIVGPLSLIVIYLSNVLRADVPWPIVTGIVVTPRRNTENGFIRPISLKILQSLRRYVLRSD